MGLSIFGNSFRETFKAAHDDHLETGGGNVGYIFIDKSLIGSGFPIVVTQWQVSFREKTHVLESFNEHVHGYAFGRGAGAAVIAGHSLENSNGNVAHAQAKVLRSQYETQLRALAAARKGEGIIRISGPGGLTISGVAQALELSLAGPQSNVMNFTMQFLILDSTLGASR